MQLQFVSVRTLTPGRQDASTYEHTHTHTYQDCLPSIVLDQHRGSTKCHAMKDVHIALTSDVRCGLGFGRRIQVSVGEYLMIESIENQFPIFLSENKIFKFKLELRRHGTSRLYIIRDEEYLFDLSIFDIRPHQ
jgi:hypothetical protein